MARYGAALLLAVWVAAPVGAGELDREYPAQAQVSSVVADRAATASEATLPGSELDRESPAQSCWGWYRPWGWGCGWGGYYGGYWGGFYPAYSLGWGWYRPWGWGYGWGYCGW